MKKIILISMLFLATLAVSAQFTTPRWGTVPGRDASFRGLSNAYVLLTAAKYPIATDTAVFSVNAYNTFLKTDSIKDSTIRVKLVNTNAYLGDMFIAYIYPGKLSGKKIQFIGYGFRALTANYTNTFIYIFNGSAWVQIL